MAHGKAKAATSDVVPFAAQRAPVPAKWRRHFERLTELREQMLNRQSELTKDALEEQPSFSTHIADAGTDTYDRDLALGLLSSEQDAIYEVEEALSRIQNGKYGICELTGKPIEPARLEAIPWTRFGAAAERQLEKQGELKHARLGPRETVARAEPTKPPEEG